MSNRDQAPSQRPSSFSIDQIMEKMEKSFNQTGGKMSEQLQRVKARRIKVTASGIALALAVTLAGSLPAQTPHPSSDEQMADIATKLQNPIASLISVPLQNNFDFGGGPSDDGFQYKLNIQPVIPISLGENWNLISRTILPYIYQERRIGLGSQSGLGDTTESLFVSPKKPGPGGVIWGIGPDLYFPTATDSLLGAEKWGAGPTGLALWQKHGWTYGGLVNHIWSFAGHEDRQEISSTFLQPFLSYTTKTHTTFGVNTESSYDWVNHQWTVPLNAFVTQLVQLGKLPVSFSFGGRYYTDKPSGGPDWGLRFTVTLVFPEK